MVAAPRIAGTKKAYEAVHQRLGARVYARDVAAVEHRAPRLDAVRARPAVVLRALDRVAQNLVRGDDGLEPLLRLGAQRLVADTVLTRRSRTT